MQPGPVSTDPIEAPDKEALVNRNPHQDFPAVEASRPDYGAHTSWIFTKTPAPKWSYGDGATSTVWQQHAMTEIDPHDVNHETNLTYKLMISSTVPRPIALVSTTSVAGVQNLAPFSYFQAVCADPPLYSIVFGGEQPNDSLRNVLATKEASVSIASDWFIEALNAASINTPPATSEWPLSGLHPVPGRFVKTAYVAEAAVSIELRYHSHQEITGKAGTRTATMVLLEAILFHIREDMLGKDGATVDISKLRPVWRGGGITYGTCLSGFELPRPVAFRNLRARADVQKLLDKDE
ncbi:flavoprotein-like protein oxygenase [Teratosphaeria destructans]|uniref:Flavoprotein-like protein oxygenase n=1 Tax=Teratosphaeria destructans TaxID=418781 RepID=A0A9W7SUV4_9PEZI|nr:flavoprotein-like protein oxygenase [Teratosphaeria destructans]